MFYPTRSYTAINDTPASNYVEEQFQDRQREILDRQRARELEREQQKWRDFLFGCIFVIVFIVVCVALLIAIIILFSILDVFIGEVVQYTVTKLFGEQLYNKYFAICSSTEYNGINGCYTTTNVYCS